MVEIEKQLPQSLADNLKNTSKENILDKLSAADDETLVSYLHWNKNSIEEKNQEIELIMKPLKLEFETRLTEAVTRQHLPLTIDQIKAGLKSVHIMFADPLATGMENATGSYNNHYKTIDINLHFADDPVRLKGILWHELLHCLSAQTYDKKSGIVQNEEYPKSDGIADPMDWVNEAITEQLTTILLSEEGATIDFDKVSAEDFFANEQGVYNGERAVLKDLTEISDKLIPLMIAAYFEGYKMSDENLPKNRKLWQVIEGELGQTFVDFVMSVGMINTEEKLNTAIRQIKQLKLLRRMFGT